VAVDPQPFLQALDLPPPRGITPLAGGHDTQVWRLDWPDRRAVLRLYRPEQSAAAQREALALAAAARAGVPVPRILGQATVAGRPVLLLSWCQGRPLLHVLLTHPWTIWRLGRRFGAVQAQIHAVQAPAALRPPARDWIAWAGPMAATVQHHLRQLPLQTEALLHLDYHPLNVLTDGHRLTAVLDWINAGGGDPRADLARTVTLLRLAPAPPGPGRRLLSPLRGLLELAWRAGYRETAGTFPAPSDLAPFYAWAGWVLLHDLAPRPDRPGLLSPAAQERVRRWISAWQRRAGLG